MKISLDDRFPEATKPNKPAHCQKTYSGFLQHVRSFIDEVTIVIPVLHDPNLALNYADELLLLSAGE